MTSIVAADIGGTHARFALAKVDSGTVTAIGEPVVLKTCDYSGIENAWEKFGQMIGAPLPKKAAIAVAAPITNGPVTFVNSHWAFDPADLPKALGLDQITLVNDFGAMAHGVDALGTDAFLPLFGPEITLPSSGQISVIGPGTGLGVAIIARRHGQSTIIETEGAHIHFAPLDAGEQKVCADLAAHHGRVSTERVVSGPGLGNIVRAANPDDGRSDADLWAAAIDGTEGQAVLALDLFLASYGAIVGDLALAHGSLAVVLAGGLTNRLSAKLVTSKFHARFCDKGRYQKRMESIPVMLLTHPQPGLFGAAAAFAKEHRT